MALKPDELGPYMSFLVARVRDDANRNDILNQIVDDLEDVLDDDGDEREFEERVGPVQDGSLWVAGLWYVRISRPGWYLGEDERIQDKSNHLVLVSRRDRHVAIHASENAVRERIRRRLDETALEGLSGLQPIAADLLAATFVEGPARTLWLSGIHRSTSVRADSKILVGPDLRDALSPLGDQSYFFTAARCLTELPSLPRSKSTIPIGVSPQKSRVWAGSARSWREFRDRTYAVLGRLKNHDSEGVSTATPLPILAQPVRDSAVVSGPYDITVVDPELLKADGSLDEAALEVAERWAYRSRFDVVNSSGASFEADVYVEGIAIGRFAFNMEVDACKRAKLQVDPREILCDDSDLVGEALRVFRRKDWIKILFDSGHVFTSSLLFTQQFRDVVFGNWSFQPITRKGFNIAKEKPGNGSQLDVEKIGAEKSLFSWVQLHWPPDNIECVAGEAQRGFICSDDGSGEIADFIHFDPHLRDGRGLLSLIHVKASSKRANEKREVSCANYELVVAQAIKNLRSLDRNNLVDRLEAGQDRVVASACWTDGDHTGDRAEMIEALRGAGERYDRLVVIVQPYVTRTVYEAVQESIGRMRVNGNHATAEIRRMQLLDTLLEGARADCRALGAELLVVSDDK